MAKITIEFDDGSRSVFKGLIKSWSIENDSYVHQSILGVATQTLTGTGVLEVSMSFNDGYKGKIS